MLKDIMYVYLGGDCSKSWALLLCFSRMERLSRFARRPWSLEATVWSQYSSLTMIFKLFLPNDDTKSSVLPQPSCACSTPTYSDKRSLFLFLSKPSLFLYFFLVFFKLSTREFYLENKFFLKIPLGSSRIFTGRQGLIPQCLKRVIWYVTFNKPAKLSWSHSIM